jgi:hypothetical protein
VLMAFVAFALFLEVKSGAEIWCEYMHTNLCNQVILCSARLHVRVRNIKEKILTQGPWNQRRADVHCAADASGPGVQGLHACGADPGRHVSGH